MPKNLPAPRFEYWRNSKKEFNYRTIGKNGKSIGGEQHQGFKRFGGMINNIKANGELFGFDVFFDEDNKYFWTTIGESIPLIEVKK